MIAQVYYRDEGSGLLDEEFKDGDVLQIHDDAFVPGTQGAKSYLFVLLPEVGFDVGKVTDELQRAEYSPGPTLGDENVIRRQRIFRLDWRTKFTADEIAIVEDSGQVLPDGALDSGGTVASGVVSGKFTVADFIRK